MLHHEGIVRTKGIKIKFKENWLSRDYLISHPEILGYSKIKKRFESCKKSVISFDSLISILHVLPIIGIDTIHSLTNSNELSLNIAAMDSFYRLHANQNIY